MRAIRVRRFQAPDPPLYRVTAVESDGHIALESGGTVQMEWIRCSTEGIRHISQLLLSDGSRVTYRRTSPSTIGDTSSEVGLVDVSGGGPPSYSLIAETALPSGWCVPTEASAGATHERYRALAAIAAHGTARGKTRHER
jgi:hypothetical protein